MDEEETKMFEEMTAKINTLTTSLEDERIQRSKDTLVAAIKVNGFEVSSDLSLEVLQGAELISNIASEKILALSEAIKVNEAGSGLPTPPQSGADEMINTPLGRKKRSEVDAYKQAKVNSSVKPNEVK